MSLPPEDFFPVVASIDEFTVYVEIAGNNIALDKGEMNGWMNGYPIVDAVTHFKANLSIALRLDGVDTSDDQALKSAIEGRLYKLYR